MKNYTTKKGYYVLKDFDTKFGGDFWFLIEPLNGFNNTIFFYVKRLENDMHEVTGESYIITDKFSLSQHKKELKEKLKDFTSVKYYFLDINENIIGEETVLLSQK